MKLTPCKSCFVRHLPLGLSLTLAVAWWLSGEPAPGQDQNPTPQEAPAGQAPAQPDAAPATQELSLTNDMAQPDDITTEEAQAPTNTGPSLTNNAPGGENGDSGRGPRSRRSRRRANQAGGLGQANVSSSDDSAAGTNGGPVSLDYSAFKIVADRNIFNPNRYPRSRPSPTAPPRETLTLVGTMSYEKGSFAFFSGNDSKALKLTDSIAGFKVTQITPDAVKLLAGTNELELRVGMQLQREEDGPWVRSSGSATYAANPAPVASSSTTPSLDAGPENEALKKLMLRAQQSRE